MLGSQSRRYWLSCRTSYMVAADTSRITILHWNAPQQVGGQKSQVGRLNHRRWGRPTRQSNKSFQLTLILWILGPRFSFFAGTSTHTCMPLLSYLFTQCSVAKHCLLKSAKTASSGKILDILGFSSKTSCVPPVRAGARSAVRARTFTYLYIWPAGPWTGRAAFLPFLQTPPPPPSDVTALPADRCASHRWNQGAPRRGQPWFTRWWRHFWLWNSNSGDHCWVVKCPEVEKLSRTRRDCICHVRISRSMDGVSGVSGHLVFFK